MNNFKDYLRQALLESIPGGGGGYGPGNGYRYDPNLDQSVPIDKPFGTDEGSDDGSDEGSDEGSDDGKDPNEWLEEEFREKYRRLCEQMGPTLCDWFGPDAPPDCSWAECPDQWEAYVKHFMDFVFDHIAEAYDRWLEHNPGGTWSEFLCDIGFCGMDGDIWPDDPPPDYPDDWPWPPFQEPD